MLDSRDINQDCVFWIQLQKEFANQFSVYVRLQLSNNVATSWLDDYSNIINPGSERDSTSLMKELERDLD